MGYLDNSGLSYLWGKIKTALGGKQDKESSVSVPGSGALSMSETLGSGPYTIEFTEEADSGGGSLPYNIISCEDFSATKHATFNLNDLSLANKVLKLLVYQTGGAVDSLPSIRIQLTNGNLQRMSLMSPGEEAFSKRENDAYIETQNAIIIDVYPRYFQGKLRSIYMRGFSDTFYFDYSDSGDIDGKVPVVDVFVRADSGNYTGKAILYSVEDGVIMTSDGIGG